MCRSRTRSSLRLRCAGDRLTGLAVALAFTAGVWNTAFQGSPAVIVRVADARDVATSIAYDPVTHNVVSTTDAPVSGFSVGKVISSFVVLASSRSVARAADSASTSS